MAGCADYLDVVPDDAATLDHAFTMRNVAEKFLYTCYNHIPSATAPWSCIGIVGGDEFWWNPSDQTNYGNKNASLLAQGRQNVNNPYLNFWDGANDGKTLFVGLRNCNIFLENIYNPVDLEEFERDQWISEVKVLKAYFHYYLLQLYGPIPVIRENIPVNSYENARVYREPIDSVVNYIVQLIDEAMENLMPTSFDTRAKDAGRITRPIAAAIKAKALVLAASPLFNGNSDYANFKDNRGVQLIPSDYDASKWTRAAEAIREAITISEEGGHCFYEYTPIPTESAWSAQTLLKCKLRGAITEKYNFEIVWPYMGGGTAELEAICITNLGTYTASVSPSGIAPTLKVAEEFYTKNGLPIDEDPEWIRWIGGDIMRRYETQSSTTTSGSGIDGTNSVSKDHEFYIGTNEITAKLNFYREPRFYAWIGFDRSIWEKNGQSGQNTFIRARAGEAQGMMDAFRFSISGYFAKKLVNMETVKNANNNGWTSTRYTYPLVRMSDLYLLYAEALNESKTAPDEEVRRWIDSVRLRAGLPTVVDSWANAIESARGKPYDKEGMREIIRRERMIELSFESQRFFDLRRWKLAMDYLNEPVMGWNVQKVNSAEYYMVNTLFTRAFNLRDYLWPLKLSTIQINSNLVQNPGW
ncbi:MAG: RagB/SusD family nutrient uptake outer membrane protein [Prevotellaceae bacterium]|jgi:hypothetical protein|nr:RagB/SusD family nutrient uptake outer membrane protein [Prevotellaceae bacterium]